jgi:hypothetical protein
MRKRQLDALAALWYAIAVWIASSCLIRYAVFTALAAVCAGLLIEFIFRSLRPVFFDTRRKLAGLLAIFILIGPNANALRYFKNNFNRAVVIDAASYASFYGYLGLPEMALIDRLGSLGLTGGTLYAFGYDHLKYYYNLKGFRMVGDHINRFRYSDMRDSLLKGQLYPFLRETGACAAVISVDALKGYDLTQPQFLRAVMNEPRLSLIYEDPSSMVIKIG